LINLIVRHCRLGIYEREIEVLMIIFVYLYVLITLRSLVWILPIPFLLVLAVYYLFKRRNYSYNLYFPVIFVLYILESFLISYIYQFKFIFLKNQADIVIFSLCVIFLVISVFINIYYVFTGKYKEFPWVKHQQG
jgi:hypothetical protein